MSEELKYYEEAWQKEKSEKEGFEKRVRELEQSNLELTHNLEQQRKLNEELSHQNDSLSQTLSSVETQIKNIEQVEELAKRLLTPSEWSDIYIVPFVDELEAFDLLSELQYSSKPRMPHQWCNDLEIIVKRLESTYDNDDMKQAKKTTIATWVYLQWLELVHEGV